MSVRPHRRGRSAAKWALFGLALAATPFCWSLGRDLFPFLFADKSEVEIAKAQIALQLVAQHKRMHVGEKPLMLTMSSPHHCYSVAKDSVRTKFRLLNKNIDGIDEDFRSSSEMVTMNGYGIPAAFFVEQLGYEALQKNLSPFRLATLNACMAASPFTDQCDASIEKAMDFNYRQVEHRLVIYGFMRHAMNEYDSEILCTTIPVIDNGDTLP